MNRVSAEIDTIESKLYLSLCNRDPMALDLLMKTYFAILCSYAEQFLEDPELAQDVVQETFISYWQYTGKFDNLTKIKAFLYTITRNASISQIRKRNSESKKISLASQILSVTEPVDTKIIWLEYLAEINLIVLQFPVKMQEVFRLSFEDGLSISEISKTLGITPKTVRNQKYKSLVILRKRFSHLGIPLLLLLSETYNK